MTSKPYNARNIGAKNNTNASHTKNSSLYRKYSGPPSSLTNQGLFTVDGISNTLLISNAQYDFSTAGTYSIVIGAFDINVDIVMWGAAGGNTTRQAGATAGSGGYAKGRYNLLAGQTYTVIVGGGGFRPNNGTTGGAGTPGNGGNGGNGNNSTNDGGGGGGFSGIFITATISQGNALIIAAGGGGASGDVANGGPGGASTGGNSSNAGARGGSGGSQVAGGSGGSGAQSGSALQGGSGVDPYGAGGGGGYFGGGGGASAGPGGGGGGSSYTGGSGVTNGSTTIGTVGAAPNPDGNRPSATTGATNTGTGTGAGGSGAGNAGYVRFIKV